MSAPKAAGLRLLSPPPPTTKPSHKATVCTGEWGLGWGGERSASPPTPAPFQGTASAESLSPPSLTAGTHVLRTYPCCTEPARLRTRHVIADALLMHTDVCIHSIIRSFNIVVMEPPGLCGIQMYVAEHVVRIKNGPGCWVQT